ncbi:alpha/beta hydrolase [Sporomusa termitida]|uniref:ESPTERase n=1 Tax=Sporomusa termitida TaxID=2377 RepID=A0A517DQB7_9FIRM|nr:alpha/beta hydrolase-fold protein [Sporomusa termitida]QDR79542.1 Putative eSPTERase [Sporomusa termitida]
MKHRYKINKWTSLVCAIFLLSIGAGAFGREAGAFNQTRIPATPDGLPADIASSSVDGLPEYQIKTFDLYFQKHGGKYRIFVSVPVGPVPANGYPVIYLLDGNMTFPMMRAAQTDAGFCPVVTVGVGYPVDSGTDIDRRYFDLTPPTSPDLIPNGLKGKRPLATGGQDTFFASIETELKPVIEKLAPIDRRQQTLFGHSLAGLFVLHTLYTYPASFQTYVAADPAIWWNGGSVLLEHSNFLESEQARNEKAPVRLLVETSGKQALRKGISKAEAASLAKLRSGPRGKEIAAALGGLPGLHISFKEQADESHGSMLPYAVADALSFALKPSKLEERQKAAIEKIME